MWTIRKFLLFFALVVIVARPSIAADSLIVSPAHPTTMDSIKLSILIRSTACCIRYDYDSTPDCCIHYVHDSSVVSLSNGSIITVGFTVVAWDVICNCPLEPVGYSVTADITYKRGPLPAGNYFVYENDQSCTGQICSDVVMQTLIGKFTVSQSSAIVSHQKPVTLENIGKTSGYGRIYDIRGALVSPNRLGASRQT